MNSRQREAIKKRQGLNKQIHYLDGKTPAVRLTPGYWSGLKDRVRGCSQPWCQVNVLFESEIFIHHQVVALHWEGDWEESTDGVESSVINGGSSK